MKKLLFYENKNIISQQLKLARIKKGLSQSQLAAKMQVLNVNLDQQMISKIEHNQRIVTDYEFACFCQALNISPTELLQDFYNHFQN